MYPWASLRACVGSLRRETTSTDRRLSHDRLRADGGEPRDEWDDREGQRDDGQDGRDDGQDQHGDGTGERGNEEGEHSNEEGERHDEKGERHDSDGGSGGDEDAADVNRSNVEVSEAGDADPADPKWEKPDLDDIPEFETGADQPLTTSSATDRSTPRDESTVTDRSTTADDRSEGPTAGMPNEARSPDNSRIRKGATEGYVVAVEICARLPDDVRLPDQAADLVPAAVEAELERDVQAFAAAEFDNDSPHVDALEFVERDDEVWLRLRLGVSPDAFSNVDPDEIRTHALQQLEGMF